jgi:hypothetical protein
MPCYPILTVKNTTGATLAAGTLEVWNYDTGDYLDFADLVPNNSYVRWDCETRRCYTSTDGTTFAEVAGKVSTNWLTILGGDAAQMRILGCSAGTLYWTYRGRYL